MPNKDRTGPEGQGPGTGGQRGPCKTDKPKDPNRPRNSDMYKLRDRRRRRRGWNQ